MILDRDVLVVCNSFKILRRGDQRRMAGAKDQRGGSAEARGCSAEHSGGQRGERFERAVRESPKEELGVHLVWRFAFVHRSKSQYDSLGKSYSTNNS